MQVAEWYDRNAGECRDIARMTADAGKKTSLLHIADTWERMAKDRRQRSAKTSDQTAAE